MNFSYKNFLYINIFHFIILTKFHANRPTAVELVVINRRVALYVRRSSVHSIDIAGQFGSVVVQRFTVEVLEAERDTVADGHSLGSGDWLALNRRANETLERGLLTTRRGCEIGWNFLLLLDFVAA